MKRFAVIFLCLLGIDSLARLVEVVKLGASMPFAQAYAFGQMFTAYYLGFIVTVPLAVAIWFLTRK